MGTREQLNRTSPGAGNKNDSPAVWFFVAVVFAITLPQMTAGEWPPHWVSMAAGVLLTSLGFWFLVRGRRN